MYLANKINAILINRFVLILLVFGLLICGALLFLTPQYFLQDRALADIEEQGEIIFITRNNAHCYYSYRGQEMGFEYDLAKAFAESIGVSLKLKIAEEWEEMLPSLLNRSAHVVGASLTDTPKRRAQVAFSDGYLSIQQHIIARRDNPNVRRLSDLSGKTVFVREGTSYEERLTDLKARGLDLQIQTVDNLPTGELIQQVAEKKIEITIADSNIAWLNRRYYPQIEVGEAIHEKEFLAWAVHPKSKQLLARINAFFKQSIKDGTFGEIYDRYYADVENFDYVDLRAYHRRLQSRLPKYGALIKTAAEKHGFDWRLIAAQIYQESHFGRWARSHRGAYGLMQLTRKTAKSLGVTDIYEPAQNINAGVRHLRMLYDLFDEANGTDRLYIALGAYNIGQGHVRDAQRIARAMSLDTAKWSSLTQTLPLLQKRKYYQKAKYGYCRGSEPVQYVKQIMIYYDILRRQSIEFNIHPLPNELALHRIPQK